MSIIKVNISGKIFEIPKDILYKSKLFENILQDFNNNDMPINIYRSAKIFEHIYAYLIDNNYPYPKKYESELKYYLINYQTENLYTSNKEIISDINNIKEIIKISKQSCTITECNIIRKINSLYCINHVNTCIIKNCVNRCGNGKYKCNNHEHTSSNYMDQFDHDCMII